MRLRSYGLSDIGLCRSNNEDVWASLPEVGFFALADGMGGRKAGEIAAKEAIESLLRSAQMIRASNSMELMIELKHAIDQANSLVYRMGQSSMKLEGMGTTLCCLLWTQNFIIYAHIGDSRIYRLRKKKLELLTKDHSLFTKWVDMGKIGNHESAMFQYKHVITRALGTSRRVKPEIAIAGHQMEDLYILCSDGLHDVISHQEIEDYLNSSSNLEQSCKKLIELAKIKGSSDNITLLMVQSAY